MKFLAVLDSSEGNDPSPWVEPVYQSDRERIDDMLRLVNDGAMSSYGESVSSERREALRAFLEERVSVRERLATMVRRLEKEAAALGHEWSRPPHRTAGLLEAWRRLPKMLNGRVKKHVEFVQAGVEKRVFLEIIVGGQVREQFGDGGELWMSDEFECGGIETVLNLALALILDMRRDIGASLCRCHAPECGRFWILSDMSPGRPSRNYCSIHAADKRKLGDRERKQRQRRRVKR